MQDGLNRATLAGVEVGNVFGNDNAFPAMNADRLWIEVAVVVPGSFKTFNSALHCTTILCPMVGAIGECSGV